jgi:polysaccharide pyruvyl transferase WcaK-like protein
MSLSKQSRALRRVFVTGTFDVANYGDLLFPLIARERLAREGIEIIPVSPSGTVAKFSDALACVSTAEMLSGETDVDGIVVGGGHIIHTNDMSLIEEYAAGGLGRTAAPGLWLGAALAAAARDVPCVWNAPGIPHPFAQPRRELIDAALGACDYLSVRDTASVELLGAPPGLAMQIVPDTAAEIAQLWPRETLGETFHALLQRKGADPQAQYLALHVRNRAVAGTGVKAVARLVDDFCRVRRLRPILAAIGPSLGDGATARDVAAALETPHVLLDAPGSLAEIAAAIAHSRLYVGASLHGYITAASYGVPGMLLARPSYRKYQGFLDHTGRGGDLARDWAGAFDGGARRADEKPAALIPPSVFASLDVHWRRLADALAAPARNRKARHAFLRAWLRAADDATWALSPLRASQP